MSSSPPTESPPTESPVRRRRGPAGWSLRTRLLVAVVALVAAVCAVIGVATTLAVYHLQVHRLDAQLYPAANRTRNAGNPDLALPVFEETLKLRKAKLGTDHPDTLTKSACVNRQHTNPKRQRGSLANASG